VSSVFESPWLLLTVAAILLAAASIAWRTRPEWGLRSFLLPAVAVGAAFGLDVLVQTDSEQIHSLLNFCRRAVLEGNVRQIAPCIASTYADPVHRNKEDLLNAAESILRGAALEKVVERGHTLRIHGDTAQSQVRFRVHLSPQRSAYAAAGSLMFVVLEIHYQRQPNQRWQIQKVLLVSVNDSPINWHDV